MSTHPNVILMAVLTPEDLSRKTMKAILSDNDANCDDIDIKIDGHDCNGLIMESDYNEDFQISSEEGDLVFFDCVTYGYGKKITWEDLEIRKSGLDAWAKQTSKKHNCSYKIFISANYW